MRMNSVPESFNIATDSANETVIRVLCVDDETSLLDATKSILGLHTSFQIETASSVDDALQIMNEKEFDVIVSDYQMPIKSGLDFLRELREKGNNVPFILFTGKGREEVAVKALNLGADRYFNKIGHPETVYGELVHGIRQAAIQRRVEKKIWDREERLRAIIGSSPDAMIITDLHGNLVDCNLETLKLLGVASKKEIMGEDCYKFIAKEEIEKVKTTVTKLLEQGAINNVECKMLTKNSSQIDVEFSANTLRDAYGKPVGAVVLARDITERKKVADAIKKSEEKYRSIVELSPDGIVSMSINGIVTSANKAVLSMTGRSKDEIVGKHFTKIGLFKLRDVPQYVKLVSSILRGNKNQTAEFTYLRKDGTERLGEAYISLLEEKGKKIGLQAILHDITEEKKIQQALQESEEKYRTISYSAQDSIVLLDESGKIIYWNPAAEKMFGYTKEETIGKELHSFIAPERFYEDYHRGFMKFKKTGHGSAIGKTLELFAKRKDETEFPIELSLSALKNNGKWCATGIVRDITERKKAEEVLARERDTLEKVTGNLNASLVMISKDYRILWTNNYTKNNMGEVTGKTCYESFSGLDHICPGCKAEEAFKTGKQEVREQIVHNPKLGNIILNITSIPIKDENGNVTEILELAVDITERKKSEEKHLESEKRFRELAELLPEVVFESNSKGTLTFVNHAAHSQFGYSKEEIDKGMTPSQFIAPQDRERAMSNLAKLMVGEETGPNEYTATRKDGTTFPVTIKSTPIIHKGKTVGIRGIMVDLTEHMKTQDKLKHTLTNVEMLNEKLGVVGKLSRHDVKNKLSIILNNVFLIRNQLNDNQTTALKQLKDIEVAVEQIEKILDFTRIYEMLGTQEKTTINVKTILDEAFMLASQAYEIELVNECENITVQADSLLRQVFYNLIENTLKHGETVTTIKVNYEETENGLNLIFTDDGIGIPTNQKELIFREGYGKGTGYGLYLIQKICEEYGWTIRETGKPGEGAQFTICIPEWDCDKKRNYTIKTPSKNS